MKRSPFGISPYELATRLKPVDRICQRWAVSVGSGMKKAEWDAPTKSQPPPLDEDTAVVVDQIIMKKCAPSSRRLLIKWYRSDAPVSAIADQMIESYHGRRRPKLKLFHRGVVEELKQSLEMTENGVILCWNITLDELRVKFEETKHPELLRLLDVQF